MNLFSHRTRLVAAATLAAVALGGAATAQAATTSPDSTDGYSVVEGCTGLSGAITYTPGILVAAKTQQALFTGTLSGCSGYYGAQAGTGTVTAVLSGTASTAAVSLSGTATVNWPASSGLNPSNVTISLNQANLGQITVFGRGSSGAFTGASFSTSLLPSSTTGTGAKRHPVVNQQLVNTAPFNASVNFG